uniref:Uncharacterized protein n=1 Tax=Anguilla anguilla TaxID=7936 RepID=A0A0E9RXI3_ANGAN
METDRPNSLNVYKKLGLGSLGPVSGVQSLLIILDSIP